MTYVEIASQFTVDYLTKVDPNGRIKEEEDKGCRTFKKKIFAQARHSPNVKQREIWNHHEQWM